MRPPHPVEISPYPSRLHHRARGYYVAPASDTPEAVNLDFWLPIFAEAGCGAAILKQSLFLIKLLNCSCVTRLAVKCRDN